MSAARSSCSPGRWLRPGPAGDGALAVGRRLVVWIVVEVLIVPFSALQTFFGIVGVLISRC